MVCSQSNFRILIKAVANPMLLEAQSYLKGVDPILGSVVDVIGDIKLKGRPANFDAFVRIIVSQQLSNKSANTIFKRVKALFPRKRITPEFLLHLGFDRLKGCGLSKSKTEYVLGLAEHFIKIPNEVSRIRRMEDVDALKTLTSLRGIGTWSASIFLLFNLKKPDIFPYGDVSLEKAISLLYGVKPKKKYTEVEGIISLWSPYRSLASLYLWEWIDRGQPELSRSEI